ncbi:putative beta-galactosidase [Cryomyces antarcticus]
MLFSKLVSAAVVSCLAAQSAALAYGGKPSQVIKPYKRAPLQEIVTWDEHSLFVRGKRVLFYSGEFHPFRLPVPSLWLDVFQKIKALGYDGVSFYTDWALLEGQPGNFTAEGVFALEPFFDAAKTAGIYLLARPGPYINAEVSGGGYPGWLQRIPGRLRTTDASYLNSTDNYVENIGRIIAKAQITNGGPVILFQPENEYSQAVTGINPFPDPTYFAYVEDQFRKAGIVVPYISNDARPQGFFAPPKPAAVDIYGHDGYPLGFDCANPYTWPDNGLPTNYRTLHLQQSPSTPYAIVEFQGGSFDPWGGLGFAQCGDLLNYEFERVFYKNDFSFGVTIFNIYMTYGGTNWGNLGHPGGYTSYDYGAAITEDRLVTREKYSEAKLEANFLQASPAYLTAVSQDNSHANGSYTDSSAIAVTALFGNVTRFFVARHAAYNSLASTNYKLTVPTSQGNITIPQLGGTLTLNGRDSKIHVTDYDLGGINLLYSSAEIFTWKRYASKTVLVVYGGPNERHELAVSDAGRADTVEGSGVTTSTKNGATILNWQTSPKRRVVQLHNNLQTTSVIVKAGYLLRTAHASGQNLALTGDLNATASIEVIGAPNSLSQMSFNGKSLKCNHGRWGSLSTSATYQAPKYSVPDLNTLKWKVIDSLPEVQSTYDDSAWTSASLTYSNNTARNLTTPTSLYASDYGYHTGNLLFRGHFTATGAESTLYLSTQGGSATGMSAWLNGVFMGSFPGYDAATNSNKTFTLPNVAAGTVYVVTVLIDNMGLDENFNVGGTTMKNPRGILDYSLAGRNKGDIKWKLTGNLGGENYRDRTRGPLNEGGLYAERQGYHLPGAPTSSWANSAGPTEGIKSAGVAFYATTFDLDMPAGYDIPLSFVFANSTTNSTTAADGKDYRVQLYVNGYQFGKYVHNIGPQDAFPVPEGIFNYHGSNYVAMSLWALDAGGAKVEGPGCKVDYTLLDG